MRAIVLDKPYSMTLTDRPEPRLESGSALVRVRSIGICGSDIHAFRGHHPFVTYPRVLGHELGVEILELAEPDDRLRPGDRACVEPILNCGVCFPCSQGRYNCCERVRVLGIHTDGGMTERITVPVNRLHKSDIDLSYDELALCETLSIGVQAVKRGRVAEGDHVLILGAGPIGLGLLVAAKDRGARICVSDPIASNRELAGRIGAERVVDPASEDLVEAVREWNPGQGGAKIVFEAVGLPKTILQCIQACAPTGRVVVVGVCREDVPIPISEVMRKEIEVLTTRNSCSAFDDVLGLFRTRRDELGRLISRRFGFEEGPRVVSELHERRSGAEIVKAVLTFDL